MDMTEIRRSLEELFGRVFSGAVDGPADHLLATLPCGRAPLPDARLLEAIKIRVASPFSPRRGDRGDLILATNRVALWRFFERYVCPAVATAGRPDYRNPFAESGRLLKFVLNGWRPILGSESRRYCRDAGGGGDLYEDLLAIATGAFLEALERQAMDILSMSKKGQLIPFHLKLRFSIQRHMHQNVPDLTGGGIRIGYDSRAFGEERPSFVSFDELSWGLEAPAEPED
jgi:hypothetical protein